MLAFITHPGARAKVQLASRVLLWLVWDVGTVAGAAITLVDGRFQGLGMARGATGGARVVFFLPSPVSW